MIVELQANQELVLRVLEIDQLIYDIRQQPNESWIA